MTRRPGRRSGGTGELDPTGIAAIDRLPGLPICTIDDYIAAVSAYVRDSRTLKGGPKKAAQIRLANALGRALVDELKAKLPTMADVVVGERKVAGALRTTKADVSEIHALDGLRLAIELKPVNLAVGRAIWNRFGDLRTFAVNIHLKFPFAVVGGVLVIPTYEESGTREAAKAEVIEQATEEGAEPDESDEGNAPAFDAPASVGGHATVKSTRHLIERAVQRLIRAGGRKTEADAAHLLEGIAVVAYDPSASKIDPNMPPVGSGLRWEEFITALTTAYAARFEG